MADRGNNVFNSIQQPPQYSEEASNNRILLLKDSNAGSSSNLYTPKILDSQSAPPRREGLNHQDYEDFMKSTNSAFSDYNFLFENIDQTLHSNTQMML